MSYIKWVLGSLRVKNKKQNTKLKCFKTLKNLQRGLVMEKVYFQLDVIQRPLHNSVMLSDNVSPLTANGGPMQLLNCAVGEAVCRLCVAGLRLLPSVLLSHLTEPS